MKALIDHLKLFFSGEYGANLFRKACAEYRALKFFFSVFGLPRLKSSKLTFPELMPQNITSLLVKKKAGAFFKFFYAPPFPIWIQLSGATTALVFLTILVLNYIIIGRQKEQLYQQTVRIGMVSLNYFADNAGIPLLEDNMIRLNTLIKEASRVEGILYAFIVDNSQHVVAHTNFQRVGQAVPEFKDMEEIITREKVSYFNYTLPGGSHALNLIKPITFKDKKLGEVQVGVSIDFIEKLTREERSSIITITIGIIVLSVIIAVLMGYNFSRPIAKLVRATRQIGKGNYRYKVELSRNDELGNLATAFNQMGEDLWAKSLMQDSFGKYVGPEVICFWPIRKASG